MVKFEGLDVLVVSFEVVLIFRLFLSVLDLVIRFVELFVIDIVCGDIFVIVCVDVLMFVIFFFVCVVML